MSTSAKSDRRSEPRAKRSGSSTNGRRATAKRPSRPIDTKVMQEATAIARQYQFVCAAEPSVGYLGRTIEMPLVMADGKTVEACMSQTLEATALAIASMLEHGERPPAPASEGKRDVQLNIRLTAEERLALDAAARRDGYRSISDYVRAAAISRLRAS